MTLITRNSLVSFAAVCLSVISINNNNNNYYYSINAQQPGGLGISSPGPGGAGQPGIGAGVSSPVGGFSSPVVQTLASTVLGTNQQTGPTPPGQVNQQQSSSESPLLEFSRGIGLNSLLTTATEAVRNASTEGPPSQRLSSAQSITLPTQTSAANTAAAGNIASVPVANNAAVSAYQVPATTNIQTAATSTNNIQQSAEANNAAVRSMQTGSFSTAQMGTDQTNIAQRPRYTRPVPNQYQNIQQPAVNTVNTAPNVPNTPNTLVNNNAAVQPSGETLQATYAGISTPIDLGISRVPHFEQQDNTLRQQYATLNNLSTQLSDPTAEGLRSTPYPAPQIAAAEPTTAESEAVLAREQAQAAAQLNNVQIIPTQQLPVAAVQTNLGQGSILATQPAAVTDTVQPTAVPNQQQVNTQQPQIQQLQQPQHMPIQQQPVAIQQQNNTNTVMPSQQQINSPIEQPQSRQSEAAVNQQ